jgi:hypothetical protein
MKPVFLSALVALQLLALPGSAQSYFNGRYTTRIGATPYGNALTSIVVTDSGYMTCGRVSNYPTSGVRGLVLRFLDANGQQRRVKYHSLAGASCNSASGSSLIALAPGKGFVMPGTYTPQLGVNRAILWRFNAQGDTLWTHRYPSTGNQLMYAGCRTRDGGFTLFGSSSTTQLDFLLIRTDSLGNKLWERTYNKGYDDNGFAVVQTPDGGFLMVGYTIYQPNGPDQDTYIVKADSLGNMLWERTYSGLPNGGLDAAGAGVVLNDGNYLVAAMSEKRTINGQKQRKNILYKLDTQGQLLWRREIGPERNALGAVAVHELPDGSIVVSGQQGDPNNATPVGNGYPEGFMYKVCANGDSVWYRSYKLLTGGRSENYIRDMRPTPDGGFVAAGWGFPTFPDTGNQDGWVFKTDSAGYLQAGGVPPTVRCRPVGVGLAEEAAAANTAQVWPNPSADGRFNVRLLTPQPGAIGLVVFDAVGRVVWRSTATAGTEVVVDLSHQPAGVYSLQTQWPDGQTRTNRLIK